MWGSWVSLLLIASLGLIGSCSAAAVEYDSSAVIINGERKIILSGSIHYPRSTVEMWSDLIQKAKEGGLDTIETYIFWNAHEPRRREYNFTGNLDFVKFFQKVQEAGLHGILRIGPYACAEWNYGGFPVWLHNIPDIKFRTNNEIFKNEMQTFTTKIVNMAKEAKLFASQGGPIILAQIENEYGNVMGPYGEAGKSYVQWCAQMAVAQNTGVPWIMCQQSDAPSSVINTCNGFYCDAFTPNNPKNPKIWTENWTGWFKKWGQKDPHRTAEDLAFSVARFFQQNGVLQNYYMYHGGTNFGRTSGGPFITTSYDYDAPLDEYGNLNQPKWGHLKKLHAALKLGEKILTNSTVKTTNYSDGWVELTTFTSNINGERLCFLSNTKMDDVNVDLQQDGNYSVPAWSVSILQDCNQEIYNTAKVNVQTSLIVKKLQENDTPQKLSWEWAREPTKAALLGRGGFKATQLLEQKAATNDQSDYLWYMTRVVNNGTSMKNVTLRVKYSGQFLHAFKPALLKPGRNIISLLSATVGLQNYGEFFDEGTEGIAGGPVELIDNGNTTDLSSNEWSYKVGLIGEGRRFYNPHSSHAKWVSGNLPVGSAMTWYKTTFQAPSGTEPVVVDLQGMGKGHAWVNGNSLGRFWPTLTADPNGCDGKCDYRGQYKENKCLSNCGNPTQRWYHVPRSFLNNGSNTLILFEEIGGNPSNVSFQITATETICGNAYEGTTLELSCNGGRRTISDVQFASFGDPQGGTCGSFQKGSVEASSSLSAVEKACIGKESCSINVSKTTFGVGDSFGVYNNRLAVQAVCK
ncbi:beta-galactosidase [Salix suchowensis]|nr:beta-galactosidase [Salix suchowensis]